MLRYKNSVMNRKKYQREVNKIVKKWNQCIKNDWLWDGRFVLRQYAAHFWPYDDKSGAEFRVWLEFTDTKTGSKEIMDFNNYDLEWYLGEWLNRCITEYWKVWDEKPNPNEQARAAGRKPVEINY